MSKATTEQLRRLDTGLTPGPLVVAAVEAFYGAEYTTCAALLKSAAQAPAHDRGWLELLRARLARIQEDVPVWSAAAATAARLLTDPRGRLMAIALQAAAAKRAGNGEDAAQLFATVHATLRDEAGAGHGEAAYLLALDAWENGDFERAQHLLHSTLSMEGNLAERIGLLGWVEVRREAYEAAGAHFLDALEGQATENPVDLRARARIMVAAAIVASESPDLELGRRVRELYESTTFPASLAIPHFFILSGLRVIALLEGDVERAWLYARDGAGLAPTSQYAALGETIAATTSLQLGDRNAARVQLSRAWDILRCTPWAGSDNEARVALTNFAIDAAGAMPAEARQAITLYQSLGARAAPLDTLDDRRLTAFEAIASARVSETLRRDLAIAEYRRAFALWCQLGYRVRAAEVALDLRRLGVQEDEHREALAGLFERAPQAWLRAQAAAETSPLQSLTPAERVVLSELLAGASAKTIATNLERSHYTVINHTRRIFAAFSVRSRARLIARCVELGIAADERSATPPTRAARSASGATKTKHLQIQRRSG